MRAARPVARVAGQAGARALQIEIGEVGVAKVPQQVARPQVLRAYDERGWIHPATRVHDGTDAAGVLAEVLAQQGVVEVHSRNIDYGCFM